MATRNIKRGDYFLLPYAGPRRDRLVHAIKHWREGIWLVKNNGFTSYVFLPSCHRVSPSAAKRILKTPS